MSDEKCQVTDDRRAISRESERVPPVPKLISQALRDMLISSGMRDEAINVIREALRDREPDGRVSMRALKAAELVLARTDPERRGHPQVGAVQINVRYEQPRRFVENKSA